MKATLWTGVLFLGSLMGFGDGFLVGRLYPKHNYVVQGRYLLDLNTGKVCNPIRRAEQVELWKEAKKDEKMAGHLAAQRGEDLKIRQTIHRLAA